MKYATIMIRNPKARAYPGWKGSPAPFACEILAYILLAPRTRIPLPIPQNDNREDAA